MKGGRFLLTLYTDDGLFLEVNQRIQGYVTFNLKKPLEIRHLMVGWSTRCNSEEVLEENTRMGKQVYVEKVQSLIGKIGSHEKHILEAKEHVFHFEIPNQELQDTEVATPNATRLIWHNIKAAYVDKKDDIHYADVIITSKTGTGSNVKQECETSPKLMTNCRYLKSAFDENAVNGNTEMKGRTGNLNLHCMLDKSCYTFQDNVAFTVQCRNSSKNGFRHLTATLIQRSTTTKLKTHHKPRIVASLVGPSVASKEVVSWNGQLIPFYFQKDSESWYTLKIELKNKFSTKLIVQIPVVITDA